ncbi:MAG TPA: GH32 C-terminal domain-containing protein [Chthoniobacteraceae bacterium]|nr:GH32 C-terminal domain-containing protein [Chthoniobacteraceae bacterium]
MFKLIACLFLIVAAASAQEKYREPFRPQFHFTPERNWMNDPNGMVFFEGEWHLFYQYNPHGNKWGHMSWGHAVSRDLVHWEHLPLALAEEDGVMIFSGSAVVDWKNTSGFGKDGQPPLVAIYTGHQPKRQDQRLAFSNDRGRTWTKFPGNPVLDIQKADFRDPKVAWHEATQRWIMTVALAAEQKIEFYSSSDLKSWKLTGEFGPAGATGGLWECPDLFPLAIEGESGPAKWVLIVNINPGGPAGGSACQYFVGDFDGSRFVADGPSAQRAEFIPEGKVFADFEGADYGGWKVEGEAFGAAPARGTLPNQQPVTGFRGAGLVNSYRGGDGPQGTLTSPDFEIGARHISFQIGGGAFAGQTCVNLLVDGKIVRTATGDERERLAWKSWEVDDLRGKSARLQVVDHQSGGWGHINLDQVIFADEPARSGADNVLWADFGADFYAAVSWSDVPKEDGRRVWLGWMSNWQYANEVPTTPWRSAMSIPRALSLRRMPDGLRLIQQPVVELQKLRAPAPLRFAGGTFAEASEWLAAQKNLPPLLEVEIALAGVGEKAPFSLHLHTGPDEQTSIAYDATSQRLAVDRTRSGQSGFHRGFATKHEAPVRLVEGRLSLRLFLDTSSLEVFAQAGETTLTELIFPSSVSRHLSLETPGGAAPTVPSITIHALRSVW